MHKNPLKSAGFKVLKAPDVPSVLIELGYVSTQGRSEAADVRRTGRPRPPTRSARRSTTSSAPGSPARPARPDWRPMTANSLSLNIKAANLRPSRPGRGGALCARCLADNRWRIDVSGFGEHAAARAVATARRRRSDGTSAMRLLLRFFGFLFAAGTIVFLVGVGAAAGLLWHFSKDLPDYSQLQDYEPPVMTRVHAADGSLLAEYAQRAAALHSDPGGAEAGDQRLPRGRGQEFLRAQRPRFQRHHARRPALRAELTAPAAARRAPPPSPSRSPRTSC